MEKKKDIITKVGNLINPKSPNISDRELLEHIYYHLLAIHTKINRLGILKYKEMNIEDSDYYFFTNGIEEDRIFKNIITDPDEENGLNSPIRDIEKFFDNL